MAKSQIKPLPTYIHDDKTRIEFHAIENVPGFTHRVVVNGVAFDWLGNTHRPSVETAQFFYDKYVAAKKAAS